MSTGLFGANCNKLWRQALCARSFCDKLPPSVLIPNNIRVPYLSSAMPERSPSHHLTLQQPSPMSTSLFGANCNKLRATSFVRKKRLQQAASISIHPKQNSLPPSYQRRLNTSPLPISLSSNLALCLPTYPMPTTTSFLSLYLQLQLQPCLDPTPSDLSFFLSLYLSRLLSSPSPCLPLSSSPPFSA